MRLKSPAKTPAPRLRVLRQRGAYGLVWLVREAFRHLTPERAVALGAGFGRFVVRAHGPRTGTALRNLEMA